MKVHLFDSKHWPEAERHGIDRAEVQNTAQSAADEVCAIIADLPVYVNLTIRPGEAGSAIPETGVSGITYSDEYSEVFFDCSVPYGKDKLLQHIRTTTFHELVHACTYQYEQWQPGVLFGVTTEGLATVFERDYANSEPLWGKLEDDATMRDWLQELKDLPATNEKNSDYFVKHPDGRKWIVYKTGVWVIDALVESGEDLFELMKMQHTDILQKFDSL